MIKSIIRIFLLVFYCFLPSALFASSGEEGFSSSVAQVSSAPIEELSVNNMDVREFVEMLADKSGLNIVLDQDVTGRVSLFVKNIQPREALRMALESAGMAFVEEGGVLRVMSMAQYKAKYGYVFGQEKVTRMIKVHFVAVKDAAALLNEIKSDTGKVIVNAETMTLILMDSAEKVRAMEEVLKQVDIQTVTEPLSFKYIRAEEVLEEVRGMLTQSLGAASVDVKNNQMVVTDTLATVERIRRTVAEMDVQGRKLVLQAKLVHIALDDEHLSGVDWQGSLENYQNLRLRGKYDFLDGQTQDRVLSTGMIAQEDFSTLLEALDTVGLVKEYPLSDITVDRREEVVLSVRLDDPELSMKRVPLGQKTAYDAGTTSIEFALKPVLSDDGSIITSVVTSAFSPRQQSRVSLSTKTGEMIVIGGMIATEKVAMVRKVPLMGDIPLLGLAFRYHNSTIKREEFVVFLTPRLATLEPLIVDLSAVKDLVTGALK
jgi:type IV pilus assembly protein PilQ